MKEKTCFEATLLIMDDGRIVAGDFTDEEIEHHLRNQRANGVESYSIGKCLIIFDQDIPRKIN